MCVSHHCGPYLGLIPRLSLLRVNVYVCTEDRAPRVKIIRVARAVAEITTQLRRASDCIRGIPRVLIQRILRIFMSLFCSLAPGRVILFNRLE